MQLLPSIPSLKYKYYSKFLVQPFKLLENKKRERQTQSRRAFTHWPLLAQLLLPGVGRFDLLFSLFLSVYWKIRHCRLAKWAFWVVYFILNILYLCVFYCCCYFGFAFCFFICTCLWYVMSHSFCFVATCAWNILIIFMLPTLSPPFGSLFMCRRPLSLLFVAFETASST